MPVPLLDRFRLAALARTSGCAAGAVVAASVPSPLLLVTLAPLASVSKLTTLAPPAMSRMLAPSAIVLPATPALPLPLMRKVPVETLVSPP